MPALQHPSLWAPDMSTDIEPGQLQALLPQSADAAERVLAGSRFLSKALSVLLERGDTLEGFERSLQPGEMAAQIAAAVTVAATGDDTAAVMKALRDSRRRNMARIAWRDLAMGTPLDETLNDLSDLADACTSAALGEVERRLQLRHGVPRSETGEQIRPVVLGMGKLGGRELNFSSDIDLIFCHTDAGETDGTRSISSDEYFIKLAQETTKLLLAQTEDGFVFRVDTMLRPFGSAGALSASFAALEDYYQTHGREWERYALIKARPIAGDLQAGQRLLQMLRPFVYRRYLDFNAIGSLRALKKLIEDEVARKGLEDNIKVGAGGIREIEFIVQSFQLVRGGADPSLRDSRLRPTLRMLGAKGFLTTEIAVELDAAYVFLRRMENAIQMHDDQQTHALPGSDAGRKALLAALDASSWEDLMAQLAKVREFVRTQFAQVFATDREAESSPHQALVAALWNATLSGDDALEALYATGFKATPQTVLTQIEALRGVRLVRAMREQTAQHLQVLLALLFDEALKQVTPELTLVRMLHVIEAVAGRSNYLTLLRESTAARSSLARLCAASPWLTEFIARAPIVLDSLLDARTLYAPPLRDDLFSELARRCALLQVPEDTERAMDALRHYQREITLRVAAADLIEALPLVQVSDRLTWLAEAIVAQALKYAWDEMRAQYGTPLNQSGEAAGFAVVGYGKFGGIELGYGSDLDLVFLHDCDTADGDSSGGPRTINNAAYLSRLAQRVINWLATQTPAGRAYEVDMELRPNGRSGMLVSSLRSFEDYQLNSAWTWEHQALTRARYVAGDAHIGAAFERIRSQVLMRPREVDKLRGEIVDMRAKMRGKLDKSTAGLWDIKQGDGGLVDLEFITQYLVLRDAHKDERIAHWSDNWRQLEALASAGSIATGDKDNLIQCYRHLRVWAHAASLRAEGSLAPHGQFTDERTQVIGLRKAILGE